ncbi:MAG: formaldehyde-activating enzyme [Acidimicrobiia bacterium]
MIQIGEGFRGAGAEAAHVNIVLGDRNGPMASAWATALASPTAGHASFTVVLRPGLAVRPYTVFVNKASIESDDHARLTWGAAQAGVASGLTDALADEIIDARHADHSLCIAAVWVDPQAVDEELVYSNNRWATREAVRVAMKGGPALPDLLALRDKPSNPFFRPEH